MTGQSDVLVRHDGPGNVPQGSIRFIGNATVLVRYAGVTILTDPNFVHRGEEVPIGYGLTTRRLTNPALEIGDLPTLDLVVLSHYHGDHFDRVAEERLDRAVPILTTPDAADTLSGLGFHHADAIETWSSREFERDGTRLRVTAMPGQHAPGPLTVALPQVMGSLLEFASTDAPRDVASLRVYITGDTVMYEGIRDIPQRHPEVDLALVHLGGTRVMGLTVTMDAEQGVELMRTVQPRIGVPIHFNDYEAFKSPLEDFVTAIREAGMEDRMRYLQHGDELPVSGERFS